MSNQEVQKDELLRKAALLESLGDELGLSVLSVNHVHNGFPIVVMTIATPHVPATTPDAAS
jgi:hypothetical protein